METDLEIGSSATVAQEAADGAAPFFSIVIPCCDVEPCVRECLDSVLNQQFTDWEALKGTHPYDIICSVTPRVTRIHLP